MAVSKHLNKKLSKALKNKWVKALESGNYKQCEGQLQNSYGENCCLGVLCRVMNIKHHNFIQESELTSVGLGDVLPKKVHSKLVKMNDGEGKSFEQIAKWIKNSRQI